MAVHWSSCRRSPAFSSPSISRSSKPSVRNDRTKGAAASTLDRRLTVRTAGLVLPRHGRSNALWARQGEQLLRRQVMPTRDVANRLALNMARGIDRRLLGKGLHGNGDRASARDLSISKPGGNIPLRIFTTFCYREK